MYRFVFPFFVLSIISMGWDGGIVTAKVAGPDTPAAQAGTGTRVARPADVPAGIGALPSEVPENPNNPTTPAKVELGKMLYFEPALSLSGQFSCNSCHNLSTGGVDNQRFSIGHKWQRGGRNAPTVLNAAFWSKQFWDGRAPLLEDQAGGPPLNPVEMAFISEEEVVVRLRDAGYQSFFDAVFPDDPNPLSYVNMTRAIAAFERTLTTPDAPFDRYVRGEGELSDAAKRGMVKVNETGCFGCHVGPLFSNNAFMRFDHGTDEGVKAVTSRREDDHLFRVQSWRNVTLTAPYFHDGSAATLREAVEIMAKTQLGIEYTDREVTDILAFLETLTGDQPRVEYPILPRPSGRALEWRE